MPKTEELTPLQELQAEALTLNSQLEQVMQKATAGIAEPETVIKLAGEIADLQTQIERNSRGIFAETVRENAANKGNAAEHASELFNAVVADPMPEKLHTHRVVLKLWKDEGDDEIQWDVDVESRKTSLPATKAPTQAKGVVAFGHTFYPKRKIHLVVEDETDYVTKLRQHLPDEYADVTDFEELILAFQKHGIKIEPAK